MKARTVTLDPINPLAKPEYEHFARLVAAGMTQTNAAITAGYLPKHASIRGSNIAKRPEVKARIETLRKISSQQAVMGMSVSKHEILRKLSDNCTAAMLEGDRSAANRALELMGKEIGMFVERKLVGLQGVIEQINPQSLKGASADDILRLSQVLQEAIGGDETKQLGEGAEPGG